MVNQILSLTDFNLFTEFFLGVTLLYSIVFGSLFSRAKKLPLIQNVSVNLNVLILILATWVLVTDRYCFTSNVVSFSCKIVSDECALFFKILILIFSIVCIVITKQYLINQKINNFEYTVIILFAVLGLLLLSSANDFITAYLAIELQSLAFYILASFKKNSKYSVDAGLKYFLIGSLASSLFLFGSSMIYGLLGCTNFQDCYYFISFCPDPLCLKELDYEYLQCIDYLECVNNEDSDLFESVPMFLWWWLMCSPNQLLIYMTFFLTFEQSEIFFVSIVHDVIHKSEWLMSNEIWFRFDTNVLEFALIFIFVSLFLKLALAPVHLWAPDVYENSPTSSTVFFSTLPKLGVFVLLIRLFYYGFYGIFDSFRSYFILIAILSIITGAFVGLEQRKLKSLLVYSSISHMGYVILAFSTGLKDSIFIILSYLLIYFCSSFCIWSIFLATRLKHSYRKFNKDLADVVLLKKSNFMLANCFMFALFSLAGFPPFIGFLMKMNIFLVVIEASMYYVAFVSIIISVISTFYYLRIVKIVYFENVKIGKLYYPIEIQTTVIVTFLSYFIIFLFFYPTILYILPLQINLIKPF
uniref:NADH dehydrogenase subunit 2 n=1 Tax=Toxarium undulatum TaxID=210620 RepID=A0A2U9GI28_9STRA|nr:NADH dehydrogenase subunit 2 [Toxarium undulatum]AWQ64127.1 NADH dehydrogenase subunit 2 [Toxarium undulatum]